MKKIIQICHNCPLPVISTTNIVVSLLSGFPGGSDGKESDCNAGHLSLIPRLGRSPGRGDDNPLQYSCLENPHDRGLWQATFHEVAKSQTRLSD